MTAMSRSRSPPRADLANRCEYDDDSDESFTGEEVEQEEEEDVGKTSGEVMEEVGVDSSKDLPSRQEILGLKFVCARFQRADRLSFAI